MKARDVMGLHVITVSPDLPVQAVANTLVKNGISAVPVVDHAGALVGMVSEGDLMRRTEIGTERSRSWWLDLFRSDRIRAQDFVKSHGHKAGDVMTEAVVTASPDATLQSIAALLERHGIKRVPIVENGRIVGIVSRANLVQALASGRVTEEAEDNDERLRQAVVSRLDGQPWGGAMVNVIVHDGAVELWGVVDNDDEKKAVRIAAEETPGIAMVTDNLRIYPLVAGS